MITTVYDGRKNAGLLEYIAPLWIKSEDLVMDVTYGKGKWWTTFRPANLIVHDLYTLDGVDFRSLPEADSSVDVITFDPSYIAQGGRESAGGEHFREAYGLDTAPRTDAELAELIQAGVKECTRVLVPGGRLLAKCMNYINGGAFQRGHDTTVQAAIGAGLKQVDEFVHFSRTGPQPGLRHGTPVTQRHARRAHSFLCVFQKPKSSR